MIDISVVCPTYQRSAQLDSMVGHYRAQTFRGSMELLILDDSPEPSNSLAAGQYREDGVHYMHRPGPRMSIGAKLDMLTATAGGEIVIRFDDDDYYAPKYVERMLEFLGDGDILTLSRWFAYSIERDIFGYWATDTLSPEHFVVSPWEPVRTVSTEGWDPAWVRSNLNGYGFATLWRRPVSGRVRFPDRNHGEDLEFFEQAVAAGFRAVYAADTEGLVLHTIHKDNTSRIFPQYILPGFMLRQYFPGYTGARRP